MHWFGFHDSQEKNFEAPEEELPDINEQAKEAWEDFWADRFYWPPVKDEEPETDIEKLIKSYVDEPY